MFCYEHPHPAVTADVAVLRHRDERLEILLVRRARGPYDGKWALPGGFVEIDEDLEAAARRELAEETGLEGMSLEQLRTFGDPGRDPRERVITVVYIAVLDGGQADVRAASDADEADWFDVTELPDLAFDHDDIIAAAVRRVSV